MRQSSSDVMRYGNQLTCLGGQPLGLFALPPTPTNHVLARWIPMVGIYHKTTWNFPGTKKLAVFERLWWLKIWRQCFGNSTISWLLFANFFWNQMLPVPYQGLPTIVCAGHYSAVANLSYIYANLLAFFQEEDGDADSYYSVTVSQPVSTDEPWTLHRTCNGITCVDHLAGKWKCTIFNIHSGERHL